MITTSKKNINKGTIHKIPQDKESWGQPKKDQDKKSLGGERGVVYHKHCLERGEI